MNLTKRIKQLAYDQQMDFVRITPAERLAHAPPGHRPTDLLRGAKSVIVLGMRISEGIREANILAHETGRREPLWSYMWFGYGQINLHFLDRTSHLITRLLEKEGYTSLPIVASGVDDAVGYRGALSNRHAAVAAGIGEFGWNTLCVTNENGPRQRFGSVITTAKLDPDPVYEGPPICDVEKCKSICLKKYGVAQQICVHVCPVKALSEDNGLSLTIENRNYTYARLHKWRCVWTSATLHEEGGVLKPRPVPDVIDSSTIARARAETPATETLELAVIGRGHRCGRCITYCPIVEMKKSKPSAPKSRLKQPEK